VRIDALGTGVLEGRILRIHPALDPLTRQGIVEIALTPLPDGFREGQFARVTLKTAARERMLVPFSALQRDREGEFLYRLTDEGLVETVRVTSGVRTADRIEILDGIAPGDRIVSRGFLGLRAGMAVTVVGDA
jgi:multidrug efflux pump subunit AcrA (membrane-fusion protein)